MTSAATQSGVPDPARKSHKMRIGSVDLRYLPGQAVRAMRYFARTTPGRLFLMAVGLLALALLTGFVGALGIQAKKDSINDLIDQREPLAVSAQQVYRSLSDADATAASAFLSTGAEPPALRQRYEADIAQAGAALGKSASDTSGIPQAIGNVAVLNQQLPVYTGLVETARVNNRLGFPAGASYLREASELMRAKILPAAQDLYRVDKDRLAGQQDDAMGFPWLTALLVLGLLAALIATQVHLTRITNRLLNVGLVVASAAVAIIILWSAVALTVQSILVDSGRSNGSEQVDVLVRARITALQARADETLTLVARGDGGGYEKEFTGLANQLVGSDGKGGLLAEAKKIAQDQDNANHTVDSAINNANEWLRAHGQVRQLDDSGDYNAAVKTAIDPEQQAGSTGAFLRLDNDLVSAITAGRQVFLDDTRNADRALILLSPGFAIFALVAGVGATIGIRERLREYR